MIKRFFDVVVSLSLIVCLLPVFVLLFFLVARNLGSPAIFRQKRPGLNGKPFTMLKFRSMRDVVDQDGVQLSDDERLTSFGKGLRATSLDELPGLVNVLSGNMSLVGPRPLLMQYLPLYNGEQAKRHDVRPGITGWAQINGRNAISWEDKFNLDVWYVNNRTFFLDIKILFLTVKKVFVKEGIAGDGEVTMSKFTGTKL